ncbi:MAG: TetR/AcrR family transcriptional regulator [Spirochaetia bacterium]|nr:TetR/AcrR family transcriptional regulator [Spirochaetia bacterium]
MCAKDHTSPSKKKARQRIIEAAAESFQSLGYARATTLEIATKAGVAEVTLFRHFGNKQKLFKAVSQQIGGGPGLDKIETQLTYNLETDLRFISQHILSFFLAQQDAIRMLMFESTHFPEMKEALAQSPRESLHLLERYFQKQIKDGKIRNINTEATAQAFLSMLFGYAIAIEPIQDLLPSKIDYKELSEEFVHIFITWLIKPIKQQGE